MASISGQSTANISGVDGFFTTSGGGITANTMPSGGSTGHISVGNATIPANPDVTPDFNIGALGTERFIKMEQGQGTLGDTVAQVAITSTGELWYNYQSNANYSSWTVPDGTWRQHGVATDWTDISMSPDGTAVMAVKNTELWFVGSGSNGQRGDGSTSASSIWIMVNNSLAWDLVSVGAYASAAVDSNQHAYLSGRNYNYMTGQGTTSGTTTTFTREKNSLTQVTQVLVGGYRTSLFVVSRNIYSTGQNGNYIGGGLHGTTANIDGPTLGYNGADIASIASANYWAAMAITTTGQLRFAGSGSYYARPDGSNASQNLSTNAYDLIDSGATGYTYYEWNEITSSSKYPAIAIKNGQLTLGGGTDSYGIKVALGGSATSTWINVGGITATCGSAGRFLISMSW